MILEITEYKNHLVFSWDIDSLKKRVDAGIYKDDDVLLPHKGIIGTQVYNTSKNLGISPEALRLIETKKNSKVGSDLTNIDFSDENYVGFLGGPTNMARPIEWWENASYGYTRPTHVVIANNVPDGAIQAIENNDSEDIDSDDDEEE
jgi:hypothetical protein